MSSRKRKKNQNTTSNNNQNTAKINKLNSYIAEVVVAFQEIGRAEKGLLNLRLIAKLYQGSPSAVIEGIKKYCRNKTTELNKVYQAFTFFLEKISPDDPDFKEFTLEKLKPILASSHYFLIHKSSKEQKKYFEILKNELLQSKSKVKKIKDSHQYESIEISFPKLCLDHLKEIVGFVEEKTGCNILHYAVGAHIYFTTFIIRGMEDSGISHPAALFQPNKEGITPIKLAILKGEFCYLNFIEKGNEPTRWEDLKKEQFPCFSHKDTAYKGNFLEFTLNSHPFQKDFCKSLDDDVDYVMGFNYENNKKIFRKIDKDQEDSRVFIQTTIEHTFDLFLEKNPDGGTPLFTLMTLLIQQGKLDADLSCSFTQIRNKLNELQTKELLKGAILPLLTDNVGDTPLDYFFQKESMEKKDLPVAQFLLKLFPELFADEKHLRKLMLHRPILFHMLWPDILSAYPHLAIENLLFYTKENQSTSIFHEAYDGKINFFTLCNTYAEYLDPTTSHHIAHIVFFLIEKKDHRSLKRFLHQYIPLRTHSELNEKIFVSVLSSHHYSLLGALHQEENTYELLIHYDPVIKEIKIEFQITYLSTEKYCAFKKTFSPVDIEKAVLPQWKNLSVNLIKDSQKVSQVFLAESVDSLSHALNLPLKLETYHFTSTKDTSLTHNRSTFWLKEKGEEVIEKEKKETSNISNDNTPEEEELFWLALGEGIFIPAPCLLSDIEQLTISK